MVFKRNFTKNEQSTSLTQIKVFSITILLISIAFFSCSNTDKELIKAVENHNTEQVISLLESGANPNAKTQSGKQIILKAIQNGDENIVQALLAADADVSISMEYSLLEIAAQKGEIDVIQALLDSRHWYKETQLESAITMAEAWDNPKAAKKLSDYLANTIRGEDARQKKLINQLTEAIQKDSMYQVQDLLKQDFSLNQTNRNGKTPLLLAAAEGNPIIAKLLIKNGANVTAKDNTGNTALHHAVSFGHKDSARILVENGANVNSKNNNGLTPLMSSAQNGNRNCAALLLEHAASPNAKDKNGKTPIFYSAPYPSVTNILLQNGAVISEEETALVFSAAAKENNKVLADHLISQDINPDIRAPEESPYKGYTPLLIVSAEGYADLTEKLLKAGAEIDSTTPNGYTPVMLASKNHHADIADMLLKKGANVTYEIKKGPQKGYGLIHLVSREGLTSLVRYCIEQGEDINKTATNGTKPLTLAVKGGHAETARYLVETGATTYLPPDNNNSPMHAAIEAKNLQLCHYLASNGGTKEQNNIIKAVLSENFDALKSALKADSTSPEKTDNYGFTPLIYSLALSNEHFAEELIQYGVNVNNPGETKHTPIAWSIYAKNPEVLSYIIKGGAEINTQLTTGLSPLITAIKQKAPVCAKKLIQAGCSIETKDEKGRTPLIAAVIREYEDVVEALLTRKPNAVNPNETDKEGKTALIYAVQQSNARITDLLIKNGVNPDKTGPNGFSPLFHSVLSNSPDCATVLAKAGANTSKKITITAHNIAGNENTAPDSTEQAIPKGEYTIFSLTAEMGNLTLLKALLESTKNIDPLTITEAINYAEIAGNTVITEYLQKYMQSLEIY